MKPNRRWSVRVGVGLLVFFVLMAIAGPWFVGNPSATDGPLHAGPSGGHLLGTTNIGQDVLSQLVVGARGSLVVCTIAAVIATVLAIAVGVTSAVLGGVWDEVLSLFTNAMLVIPTLPLVVVIAGYMKNAGAVVVAVVIAATGWSWSARILRAQALSLRRRDFVLAARASGEGSFRIVTFEVLPHLVPLIAAQFLGVVLYAIMTQAGLAFLGIGSVTDWTWGTMLYWANASQAFQLGQWWWYVPPGLCIALFGTALVLLNSAIDRVADNRLVERAPRRPMLLRRRGAGPIAAADTLVAGEEVPA
jgi:peptide/nickel transport system permease protein